MSEKEDNLILPPIINRVQQKEIDEKKEKNSEIIKDIEKENISKEEKTKEIEKIKNNYKEEIEKLKKELEEKNRLLIELQNEDNPEFKIPELIGKIEAQKLLEFSNENKIKQQKTKIESIKNMVKDLDEQFKYQLKLKEQKINKKLEPFVKKNNDLIQEINSCKEQISQMTERLEKGNNNLINLKKEKSEIEELIIKREEKLNIFFDKLNLLEEMIKKKTKLLKENDLYIKELIKIVEEQKEVIKELEKNNENKKYSIKDYISPNSNININKRYNSLENNQFDKEINNDNENNSNNIALPNIYYNKEEINQNNENNNSKNEEDKINKDNLDEGFASNEEKNKIKFNEFKNLVDDLYNNVSN